MIAAGALRVIAATLPPGVRDRYREEWLADAASAAEHGIRPASLVQGALGVAVSIDRDDPVVAGVEPRQLMFRRLRITAATGVAALLLLIPAFLVGGEGAGAVALLMVAALMLLVTLAAAIGATRVAMRSRGRRAPTRAVSLVGLAVLAALVVAALLVAPFAAVPLVGGAVLTLVLLLVISDPRAQPAPVTRPRAVALAALSAVAILGTLSLSLLQVFVWDPLAKLPGMTLDEIYAQLDGAGELPSAVLPTTVVVLWVVVAVAAIVCAGLPSPQLQQLMTARRILGFGLLGVGLVGLGHVALGFGMGMSIADAFGTSGADATGVGAAISLAGVAALIVSAFVGLLPTRIRTA